MLTYTRLREVLHYYATTGQFRWLVKPNRNIRVGSIAGCLTDRGYIGIKIDGRRYKAHRLAWFFMTGSWPEDQVDHKDRDRANNRWLNLREANRHQNSRNAKLRVDNSSGVKGVYWIEKTKRWRAVINGPKNKHLGYFSSLVDATMARQEAERAHYGEYASGA